MDITEFLTACVAEDETVAKVARDEHAGKYATADDAEWDASPAHGGVYTRSRGNLVVQGRGFDFDLKDGVAAHIARHDPARVLREVEAKRRVLARHTVGVTGGRVCLGCNYTTQEDWVTEDINECPELRDMASGYEDRPGYKEEWKP